MLSIATNFVLFFFPILEILLQVILEINFKDLIYMNFNFMNYHINSLSTIKEDINIYILYFISSFSLYLFAWFNYYKMHIASWLAT